MMAQNTRDSEVFMRLPGSALPTAFRIRFAHTGAWNLLALCILVYGAARVPAQLTVGSDELREHDSVQWREIEQHLPDPKTATPQALELQADILRARRFPADAMDFYNYAIARGGNASSLLNKLGLAELEMKNVELARAYFKRALKLNSKDADAWNNLGAVEYLDRGASIAIEDYRKAIKLDKRDAVFHANLATACFEVQDFKGARREIGFALKLDPGIFDRQLSTGGVQAHVLTSEDRARFAYEMARMYARNNQEDQMLHSLAMASEAGMDVQREMRKDEVMAKFENDPRVVVLVHNAQMVRGRHSSTVSASGAAPPPLKPLSE
jgi:tetratricopeptide (TPR) repeat protein